MATSRLGRGDLAGVGCLEWWLVGWVAVTWWESGAWNGDYSVGSRWPGGSRVTGMATSRLGRGDLAGVGCLEWRLSQLCRGHLAGVGCLEWRLSRLGRGDLAGVGCLEWRLVSWSRWPDGSGVPRMVTSRLGRGDLAGVGCLEWRLVGWVAVTWREWGA